MKCPTAAAILLSALCAISPAAGQDTASARPFLAALSVTSVPRTAGWYRDHFGFRILSLDSLSRPGIAAALLERNGFYLEIVSVADSRHRLDALPNPATNGSLQGLYKLGFWVPDADSAAQALQRAGVSLYRPLGADSSLAGGVRYFLVRDPDSTVVQVFGPLRRGR